MSRGGELEKFSRLGRQAAAAGDWRKALAAAEQLNRRSPGNPEAKFIEGLAHKAAGRPADARRAFEHLLSIDSGRYDAAVELAATLQSAHQYAEARRLLDQYRALLEHSPRYLDMAGSLYGAMRLYDDAWAMHKRADEKQPGVEQIRANLAVCAVYLGKLGEAKKIYRELLRARPDNQRYHYELSQLQPATDETHIRQMQSLIAKGGAPGENYVYLLYAIGKEYEDLGDWHSAFEYLEMAGKAVKKLARYEVAEDVALIDTVIETCTQEWLADRPAATSTPGVPIFVVGLPRTGTTLTDRILSSHSMVQSAGESQLLQMVLRDGTRANNAIGITAEQIRQAAGRPAGDIAQAYFEAIAYRLGEEPMFIEKLPENVLYLGFIARSWRDARIVHLRRHPLDACFAMFKQSYFRFAYTLDDLAEYYLAYDRLSRHWRDVLGERMVEVSYEALVSDPEAQTRELLSRLGLDFEPGCLDPGKNQSPVATASSAQVRESVHTRSVGRWRHFAKQLEPLRERLEAGGVALD